MIKRNLSAYFHRNPCDRKVLLPLLEKMTEQEMIALYQLLQSKEIEITRTKKMFTSFR